MPLTGLRVLVVDDNVDIVDSLSMLLHHHSADVRVAYDGRGALAMANAFSPHVVVLDVGMPLMDGHETAAALRRVSTSPLLVAVSAWTRNVTREDEHGARFDHYFTKPADFSALLAVMEKECDRQRAAG